MASSVSSERAFSAGGITISKCWNCLKGDIIEALQVLKCAIRHDLLFRVLILEFDDEKNGEDSEEESKSDIAEQKEKEGWDVILNKDEDELDESGIDMDLDDD